jgi:hypothetical protein
MGWFRVTLFTGSGAANSVRSPLPPMASGDELRGRGCYPALKHAKIDTGGEFHLLIPQRFTINSTKPTYMKIYVMRPKHNNRAMKGKRAGLNPSGIHFPASQKLGKANTGHGKTHQPGAETTAKP